MSAQPISARVTALPRGQVLRLALRLDAVVTAVCGVAYLALAGPLAGLIDLSPGFLRAIGAFLIVFAVAVWLIALRPRPLAAAVIAVNVPWVVASLALVVFDLYEPSSVGIVWIVLQAIVVALFAGLQAVALRSRGA